MWPEFAGLPRYAREAVEADALYSGYLARQEADIVALRRDESLTLPLTVDYAAIPSLSAELRQKLERVRPASLGQAARIDGMTPAALTAILGHVRRYQIRASA
jgi:tRNA uridine 5-carboxymethylaminomethyl modification enzyme